MNCGHEVEISQQQRQKTRLKTYNDLQSTTKTRKLNKMYTVQSPLM